MNSKIIATGAGAMFLLALVIAYPVTSSQGGSMDQVNDNLIRFSEADSTEWQVINDGVMGGVSRSRIRRTERSTGIFEGDLSLENGGGFASVRTSTDRQDLSAFDGLELRLRGDGRTYQLRLRTDDRQDGIAYSAQFETRNEEWTTVQIPFDAFTPVFRGRTVIDAPPLDRTRIHQLAFMLADKRPGSFSVEVESVRPWKAEETGS